ncbi:low molecular weight phosphatase family protein [Lederbergia citrea]|uniref:low molecular weight phosphatase family protein n=1 Tax=Lederbergia citrea TaxID=2833581 RepID=UPI001BC99BCA|nr:low molecular weight phosphatase family protein [Lederbergia citrea]MBS4177532.1 low molecular weight phosphatase family protein [Lederbergia citrea]
MQKNLLYFLSPHHNRSAIAEAWAEKSSLDNWKFTSCGWGVVQRDPLSVKAMHEVNIDLTNKPSRLVSNQLLEQATCVIAIYDFYNEIEPSLPALYKGKLVKWNIPDPGKTSKSEIEKWAKYQEVCDIIAENVKGLEISLKTIR